MSKRTLVSTGLASTALSLIALAGASPAQAQYSNGEVKIGVLTDMSGPYSAMGGPGSVAAAQLAIDDCLAAECKGMKIELVQADHQNKADVGAAIARQWLDQDHVDAMVDLTNSSVALAVQKLIKEKGGIAMYSGPATTKLTNDECASNGFHWMFDTYSQAAVGAAGLTKAGFKSWYFITVDYAFGHSLEKDASDQVIANGGQVLGTVRHPLNNADFSSFLLQAQGSKAQVIGLANGGQDTVNAVKQAKEFGIGGKDQKLSALLVFLSDVHSLGLETAQGLSYAEGFYWDADDDARKLSARFEATIKGAKPTMVQGGVYSSVRHYLRSVASAGTDDWKTVAATMRKVPIQDPVMHNATIRADGRVIHDMYVYEVKTPAQSKYPWDYLTKIGTVPAEQAFQPLSKSTCPLVKG